MTSESPQSLSASIALGLSASRFAPIAPVASQAPRTPPPASGAYRHALVLAGSRRRSASIGHELARALAERGIRTRVHLAGKRRASVRARLAVCPVDLDLIIVVGRAQRLAEVFSALPFPDTAVAYLPFGERASGRWLARAHALPRDVDGMLEVILARETIPIPMAQVGDDLALVRAGFGLEGLRARRRDSARQAAPTLAPFAVELDGQRLPGSYASLAALPDLDTLRVELWPEPRRAGTLPARFRTRLARLHLPPGRPGEVREARSVRVLSHGTDLPGHADGRASGPLPLAVPGTEKHSACATIRHVDGAYRLLHPTR